MRLNEFLMLLRFVLEEPYSHFESYVPLFAFSNHWVVSFDQFSVSEPSNANKTSSLPND